MSSIPASVRQAVLLEAGYKCANPICRNVLAFELHHIIWVKDGGAAAVENLLALCGHCHDLHTAGHIPRDAINAWKSLLVSLNNPSRASVDLLLFVYREECSVVNDDGAPETKPPNSGSPATASARWLRSSPVASSKCPGDSRN